MNNLIKKILVSNLGTNFILLKVILFFVIGFISIVFMITIRDFDLLFTILLFLTLWSWCRIYYFCFYIIHKFFDPEYKFNGLFHFFLYLTGLEKKIKGTSIEGAALDILIRRGYTIDIKKNIIKKYQDQSIKTKKWKNKLLWDEKLNN